MNTTFSLLFFIFFSFYSHATSDLILDNRFSFETRVLNPGDQILVVRHPCSSCEERIKKLSNEHIILIEHPGSRKFSRQDYAHLGWTKKVYTTDLKTLGQMGTFDLTPKQCTLSSDLKCD